MDNENKNVQTRKSWNDCGACQRSGQKQPQCGEGRMPLRVARGSQDHIILLLLRLQWRAHSSHESQCPAWSELAFLTTLMARNRIVLTDFWSTSLVAAFPSSISTVVARMTLCGGMTRRRSWAHDGPQARRQGRGMCGGVVEVAGEELCELDARVGERRR
jgi:hypothetical protein